MKRCQQKWATGSTDAFGGILPSAYAITFYEDTSQSSCEARCAVIGEAERGHEISYTPF